MEHLFPKFNEPNKSAFAAIVRRFNERFNPGNVPELPIEATKEELYRDYPGGLASNPDFKEIVEGLHEFDHTYDKENYADRKIDGAKIQMVVSALTILSSFISIPGAHLDPVARAIYWAVGGVGFHKANETYKKAKKDKAQAKAHRINLFLKHEKRDPDSMKKMDHADFEDICENYLSIEQLEAVKEIIRHHPKILESHGLISAADKMALFDKLYKRASGPKKAMLDLKCVEEFGYLFSIVSAGSFVVGLFDSPTILGEAAKLLAGVLGWLLGRYAKKVFPKSENKYEDKLENRRAAFNEKFPDGI